MQELIEDFEEQPLEKAVLSDEERMRRLDALGMAISAKRSDAILARQQSGIEQQWEEDQEFYEGIDDANRGEIKGFHQKPPYTAVVEKTTQSTIFPNITAPYCDAAAARIGDTLLSDTNFKLRPTPIPDLIGMTEGKFKPELLRQVAAQNPGRPDVAQTSLKEAQERASAILQEAKERAEKAQTRIQDWHTECQWHAEVRKIIDDAARIGSGVIKGPEPVKRRSVGFMDGALVVSEEIKPASKRIRVWDLFPERDCGESVHNGSYIFERDRLLAKKLLDLKGLPGYIDSQIDACIEEGPMDAISIANDPENAKPDTKKKQFEVWYYYGLIDHKDMEAAGCECQDGSAPAILTIVNNRVIRAALNPLDTGDFPYDVIPWRKKAGMPWGDGVGRQIRPAQRIVTAALRAMMTNAGRAAGPIIIWKQGVATPADGITSITPWKIFYVGEDANIDDVSKVMATIKIPMYQTEMERIIQIGLKFAEDITGLPMLLQGQQGKAPDTVGGMQILNDNASALLRRMARTFDDYITEPHVRRYYAWLLQYGEDSEKGDFQINARVSSALAEKNLQAQEMGYLLQASNNPAFKIDPSKTMIEYLKSRRFDPKNFEYDDERWQQIVEGLQRPQDQRLAIAQLQIQAEENLAQFKAQMEERMEELKLRFESNENSRDRELDLILKEMETSGAKSISLDVLKGRLADTTLKTRTQKELSVMGLSRQALSPPTEPVGRAAPGRAFQA